VAIKRGKITGAQAGQPPRPPSFKGTPIQIKGLGWIPDLPDPRDLTYAVPAEIAANLPSGMDLRSQCPAIYDQGQIGSCTANAIAGAIEFEMIKQVLPEIFTPSRLFIYYNERVLEGSVPYDRGASLRDGMRTVSTEGVCPESDWPYDAQPASSDGGPFPSGSRAVLQPSQSCYDEAQQHKTLIYRSVSQNAADMKGCLASGFPFMFGFLIFDSFRPDDANVPLPSGNDHPRGGHAVLVVGFDDDEQRFIIRNSWGEDKGDAGYFYMPYAYLLDPNLSRDFWTVRLVQ
jgi:C1A family cysteine protease